MNKILLLLPISIYVLCFVIEKNIVAASYELVEEYPALVRQFRGKPFDIESGQGFASKDTDPNNVIQNKGTKKRYRRLKVRHSDDQPPIRKQRTCLKCPREIIATARAELDGILVELPAPLSCKTNLPFTSNLYRIETLFGPDIPFILPEGRHRIIGRIRNVETGLIVHSCQLRYTVVVRRCKGFPRIKNKQLKMSCTAGMLWGSKCAFKCRDERLFLSHREPIVCNDDLQWQGNEPNCMDYDTYEDTMTNDNSIDDQKYCLQPEEPANGHFSCDSNDVTPNTETIHLFGTGSICHVKCNPSYSIPFHLYQMSMIECQNGSWNLTDIEFCYKEQPMRRHIARKPHMQLKRMN